MDPENRLAVLTTNGTHCGFVISGGINTKLGNQSVRTAGNHDWHDGGGMDDQLADNHYGNDVPKLACKWKPVPWSYETSIDVSLLRPGRFEHKLLVDYPNQRTGGNSLETRDRGDALRYDASPVVRPKVEKIESRPREGRVWATDGDRSDRRFWVVTLSEQRRTRSEGRGARTRSKRGIDCQNAKLGVVGKSARPPTPTSRSSVADCPPNRHIFSAPPRSLRRTAATASPSNRRRSPSASSDSSFSSSTATNHSGRPDFTSPRPITRSPSPPPTSTAAQPRQFPSAAAAAAESSGDGGVHPATGSKTAGRPNPPLDAPRRNSRLIGDLKAHFLRRRQPSDSAGTSTHQYPVPTVQQLLRDSANASPSFLQRHTYWRPPQDEEDLFRSPYAKYGRPIEVDWTFEEFAARAEDPFNLRKSDPHQYSSASTLDFEEAAARAHHSLTNVYLGDPNAYDNPKQLERYVQFDELVKKYSLYPYLSNAELPPELRHLPEYDEAANRRYGLRRPSDAQLFHGFRTLTPDTDRRQRMQQQRRGSGNGMAAPSTLQEQYMQQTAPLQSVKGICGIPARLTGFFAALLQMVAFIMAIALTILLFLHIGGMQHLSKVLAHNQTDPLLIEWDAATPRNETFPTPMMLEIGSLLTAEQRDPEADDILLPTEARAKRAENGTFEQPLHRVEKPHRHIVKKVFVGPFEQLPPAVLHIGHIELDLLAALRCSSMVFGGLCVIWLFSIICLGLSLRFEILDLVYINTFVNTVIVIYTLVQAILVGVLIFKQEELNWGIIFLIAGTTGGYVLCFIFTACALVLLVVWYRYIDYMNGSNETCLCTSTLARAIKSCGRRSRSARRREAPGADYSIPEATRHANLPYIDDQPVQQFSNF